MKGPVSPSANAPPAVDLESTAELPVLDPPEAESEDEPDEAAEAAHVATDTWILPPGVRVAPAAPSGRARTPPAVAAAPTVPPTVPPSGGPELRELEANLHAALAKLHDSEQLAARQRGQLREQEAARTRLEAAHRATEESVASLRAELARREAGAMQHATDLEAATRARTLAEQRAASVSDELIRAHEKSSTLSEQVAQLQRRLEQHQAASSGDLIREREQQQALTAQAQAHSARLIQDLHLERARSASCLESLQTLETRRLIAENTTIDLQREMDSWESSEAELRGRLGGRDKRVQELETELDKRAAQISALEQQLAALVAKVAERDGQLRDAQHHVVTEQANVQRLQQEAVAAAEHSRELEARIAQHGAGEAQRQEELQRLRTQRAELDVMLVAERDATAAAVAETAAREAALVSERARSAQLEALLAAERQHVAELEGEVTTMTGEMETWSGVLRNAQQERNAQLDGIQAAEERARSLEQELGKQRAAAQQLQADFEARSARVAELEGEVRMAGESIFRLEAELGSRSARIEALEKANEHWRTTAAVRDSSPPARGSGRAASRRSRQPDIPPPEPPRPEASEVPSREEIVYDSELHPETTQPADGVARLLILSEGEREVVHVLGRKTSVGRTPDNDLQIEGRYISRHHAVILAGPTNTLIEDLNSTNGVMVNGRRVMRQVLQDGDQVTIGRTLYRYVVRPGSEPR